jgi:hypothetical protein
MIGPSWARGLAVAIKFALYGTENDIRRLVEPKKPHPHHRIS